MLIDSMKLRNILSFGPETETIKLCPLNLIIGPNGSGKSNLLEAIDLLRNAPEQITRTVREGGGISDWLWKGIKTPTACLEAVLADPQMERGKDIRYSLSFASVGQRFEIVDERIEDKDPDPGENMPYFYYHYNEGKPYLNVRGRKRALRREDIDVEKSVLAQRRDPEQYPEITYIAREFGKLNDHRLKAVGFVAAESRIEAKASLNVLLLKQSKACD
jgi:predicted ATPase